MRIEPFPLPSDISKVVYFRVPTVKDSMDFSELNPAMEEASTTLFLNQLQDKEKYPDGKILDSGLWTGEDRRTALWWIFIATREDPSISVSYQCESCGETHYPTIPLPFLGETSTALSVPPAKGITFKADGKEYSATVKPLTGYALEHIEQIRMPLADTCDERIEKRIHNEAAIAELIHTIEVEGQPDDHNKAFLWKKGLIEGMETEREFRPLAAKVEQSLRALRHGLLTKYKDGRYYLVTETAGCDSAKEGSSMTLLLPFHAFNFISSL